MFKAGKLLGSCHCTNPSNILRQSLRSAGILGSRFMSKISWQPATELLYQKLSPCHLCNGMCGTRQQALQVRDKAIRRLPSESSAQQTSCSSQRWTERRPPLKFSSLSLRLFFVIIGQCVKHSVCCLVLHQRQMLHFTSSASHLFISAKTMNFDQNAAMSFSFPRYGLRNPSNLTDISTSKLIPIANHFCPGFWHQ